MKRFCIIALTTFFLACCFESPAFSEVIGDCFIFVKGEKPVATLIIGSKMKVDDDLHFAEILADTIKEISGVKVAIADISDKIVTDRQVLIGTPNDIPLLKMLLTNNTEYKTQSNVDSSSLLPENLGDQGFIIHKIKQEGKEYLVLTARTALGILYAVNTLQDRLHMEAGQLIADGFGTGLLRIVNIPAFRYRSLQTAVGGPDFLGSGQYMKEFGYDYKSFVDWLASHKINNILLHDTGFTWGICYDSKRFPELVGQDHPNVKKDYIGDIIKYGRNRGVTVLLAHNMPDRCHFIVRVYPELAGTIDANNIPSTHVLCLNNPKVMEIWKGYWDEILDYYPGVEAIGCQFGEGVGPTHRCQCKVCGSNQYYAKQLEFFDAMVQIARSKNPPVKCWIWRVPGAKDIVTSKNNYPDLIDIDWRQRFRAFMLGYRAKGDWYLYHHGGDNPEFGVKEVCMALQEQRIEGIQIRAVQFKEQDILFQALEEFTWNPELSIDDYAHLYTIKVLRKKDKDVANAYAAYIRARGYYEIFREDNRGKAVQDRNMIYDRKFGEQLDALKGTLENIRVECDFVDWLRSQALEPSKMAR